MNLKTDLDPLDLLDINWNNPVELYDNKQSMYSQHQSSNSISNLTHSGFHENLQNLQPTLHHRTSFNIGHMQRINDSSSSLPCNLQQISNNFTNSHANLSSNNLNQSSSNNVEADTNANLNNSNMFRKNSNTFVPTIASVYEPKFIDIYNTYKSFIINQQINIDLNFNDISKYHLMTLCLNNLLTFSNWVRDSSNSEYIRSSLFENQDLRPEVRNGLAMILVYTFSAALSHDMKVNSSSTNNLSNLIDMFGIISKPEIGMGIMNKTSLKIYSDPFGYFNFIKTCISGLIDASAIPENERNNIQQTKKIRRGSKNRDEVQAFEYLKISLVAMFEAGETQLARSKINQILEYWHIKGKSVRNERFSSIFCLPIQPINNSSLNYSSTISSSPENANNSVTSSLPSLPINPRKSFLIQNSSNYSNGDNDSVNSNNSSPYSSFYDKSNNSNSLNTSNGSNGFNVLHHRYTNVSNISMIDENSTNLKKTSSISTSIPIPCMKLNRIKPLSWTSIMTFIFDLDSLNSLMPSATYYLINYDKFKKYLDLTSNDLIDNDKNNHNFENEGSNQDDTRFPPVSFDIPLNDVYNGVSSLEKLLIKSKALITLWTPIEFLQLHFFINSWRQINSDGSNIDTDSLNQIDNKSPDNRTGHNLRKRSNGAIEIETDLEKFHDSMRINNYNNKSNLSLQQIDTRFIYNNSDSSNENSPLINELAGRKRLMSPPELNLIDYWNLLNPSSLSSNTSTTSAQAILLYEKSCEVGIVIRMNKKYNINEDIWCLIYPELKIRNQNNSSFLQFLNQLFPHITLFQENNYSKNISLGYYSHPSSNNLSIPSGPSIISQYRSLGNINEPFFNIYSLLLHDASCHDFILY